MLFCTAFYHQKKTSETAETEILALSRLFFFLLFTIKNGCLSTQTAVFACFNIVYTHFKNNKIHILVKRFTKRVEIYRKFT
jgi:hypothetical protein